MKLNYGLNIETERKRGRPSKSSYYHSGLPIMDPADKLVSRYKS